MKRILLFFFFLLLFNQCDQVEIMPPVIIHGAGQDKTMAAGRANGNSFGAALRSDPSVPVFRAEKKRMKKKNAGSALREQNNSNNSTLPVRSSDSLFISRLKYLRSGSIEPDLNEPVSRNYLFSPVDNRKFPSMITLSRESFLQVDFDNDILDYTDRFYTNGIRIKLISPVFQMNPLSRLTIPYRGSGTNYYGLSLVQNMFTPSTTKTGGILYGDRPYAAYLYLGSFKITNDPVKNFRQTSELDIGIIGPNSYGEWVQRSFHDAVPTNNEPLGWEYQVQNDIIVNYSISYEKGVFNGKNFDFLLSSTGNVGTLYTNFSAGGQIRTGWFNPYFANLGVAKKRALHEAGLRKTQFFFFIKGSGKLVGYDATLQGGMFNTSSSYVLPASGISRLVFQGSGGFSFSRNGIRIDLEQFILSPEFQHGWWHKWVHVALSFGI